MWEQSFKSFCPTNYCIENETCHFVDDMDETLPAILWNIDFSPMTLDEMRQGGYHQKRCTPTCQ